MTADHAYASRATTSTVAVPHDNTTPYTTASADGITADGTQYRADGSKDLSIINTINP